MLLLDGVLLALVVLVLAPRFTGLGVHEWVGLVLFPPLLLHLLLSWDWVAGVLRKLLGGAPPRSYVNFGLNAALFVLTVNEIVSGVMISQVALPFFGVRAIDDTLWRTLHNQFLGWLRLVMGLHLAMNWRWVATTLAKWTRYAAMKNRGESLGPVAVLLRALVILATIAVIGGAIFLLAGPPTMARFYGQNEIEHFAGAPGWGVFQLIAQMGLLALVAYAGHRWLRVRL